MNKLINQVIYSRTSTRKQSKKWESSIMLKSFKQMLNIFGNLSDDSAYLYQDKSKSILGNEYFIIEQGLPDHGMMICEIDY